MPPKISEEHAAARRLQILMAAMHCFADKGFHKTTVQDICNQAELSPGAVYSYFQSKDEIIEGLGEMGREMNDQAFDAVKQQPSGGAREVFTAALGMFLSQYRDPLFKTAARMDTMLLAESLTNPQVAKITRQGYEMVMERITELVRHYQDEGGIAKELDATAIGQVMFSLVQGLTTQIMAQGKTEADPSAYQEAAIALVQGRMFTGPDTNPAKGG